MRARGQAPVICLRAHPRGGSEDKKTRGQGQKKAGRGAGNPFGPEKKEAGTRL